MVVYLTPETHPTILWGSFYEAIGPQVAKDAYGWETPPPAPRPLEQCWRAEADRSTERNAAYRPELVGWGSLIQWSPDTQVYWFGCGVFPAWQRHGISAQIRRFVVDHAFKRCRAQYVVRGILLTNPEYLRHVRRDPQWAPSGICRIPPPGYIMFSTSRERWMRDEQQTKLHSQ